MTDDRRALALGLTAVLLWSTVATAFKIALRYLDVLQLLFFASLVSSLALCAIVAWRGQLALVGRYLRQSPRYYLLMAVLNPCAFYLILFTAYDLLPAQQAQTINYTWAIALSLMAAVLLGQRLRPIDIAATVLGYSGVVVIATRGEFSSLRVDSTLGVSLALLSTVVWAYYWIVNIRNNDDPVVSMCINFLLATPLCLLLCLLFSPAWVLSWQGLAAACYAGLFEMGITFALWSVALRSASRVSPIGNLIFLAPFLSLVLIHYVLGEPVHGATVLGLLLIVPAAMMQQLQRTPVTG